MALTELTASGVGAGVEGLHPVLTVIHADGQTRDALATAAATDAAVIIGPDEAMRLASEAARIASEAAHERAVQRLQVFERRLDDMVAAQETLRRAGEGVRRAEEAAEQARAALRLVEQKRAEADAIIAEARSAMDRDGAADGAEDVAAQIAEVRRAIEATEAVRRATLSEATAQGEDARSIVARADRAVRALHGELLAAVEADADVFGSSGDEAGPGVIARLGEHLRTEVIRTAPAVVRGGGARVQNRSVLAGGASVPGRGPRPADMFAAVDVPAGSTVVFVEPFPPFPPATLASIRAALTELARTTQVVYLTEQPSYIEWAQALPPNEGSARFATIDPSPAAPPDGRTIAALTVS